MEHRNLENIIRFAIPVAVENLLTQVISMLVPALIGGISGSALAAVGLVNQAVTMLTMVFSLMSVGGAALLARSIGAGNADEASRIAEQNILLTALASLALTAALLAGATPAVRLLMPAAEAGMFGEAVVYFRYMMISFLPMMINTVIASLLRAAGDSRGPMAATTAVNLIQAASALVLIRWMNMGIDGAGLSYVIARLAGMALVCWLLIRHRSGFRVRWKRILRPHLPTWGRTLRIGLPTSLETTLVQAGYLIANSMIVGLGTHDATVYQITNTLYNFAAYPQGICGPILISFVGRALGAGDLPGARRTMNGIFWTGMAVQILFALIVSLNIGPLSRLYTQDAAVLAECRITIWYMFVLCIPAVAINALDPALRTGGDTRAIMLYTIFAVWAIRVPLTWLMCYRMDMGVAGLFTANIISLIFRATCSQVRLRTGRWIHKNV